MRLHPSARVHETWLEIIRDYEGFGELVTFYMTHGDENVSKRFDSGSLSADIGALPWTLDCDLAARVPVRRLNAPVRLYCEIAGAMFGLFRGGASYPQPSAEWTTQLSALTPGHWMDKSTLEEYTSYSGWEPQDVIRNALYRVPYDKSRVNVEPFEKPLIYRVREQPSDPSTVPGSWASGFEDSDTPKSILDSVTAEVNAVSVDSPIGGNDTVTDPGIGENSELAWDYEANSTEVLEPFISPSWADPDSQFTSVRVQDKFEDGTFRIPPEDWPIDYKEMDYPPQVVNTYYVALSDQTNDALVEARKQAVKLAETLGKGMWAGGITVAFNPFLELLDTITVGSNWEDDSGRYRRLWRCVIESMDHQFGTETLATDLGFRAALIQDRRLPDPPILLRGISSGVSVVPGQGIAYGIDEDGDVWIDPAKVTGSESWVGIDEDGDLWVDVALAPAGIVGFDEDGDFYLDPA